MKFVPAIIASFWSANVTFPLSGFPDVFLSAWKAAFLNHEVETLYYADQYYDNDTRNILLPKSQFWKVYHKYIIFTISNMILLILFKI